MEYTIYNESLVSYVLRNTQSQGYISAIIDEDKTVFKETYAIQKAFVFDLKVDAEAAADMLNRDLFEGEKQIQVRKIKVIDIGEVE